MPCVVSPIHPHALLLAHVGLGMRFPERRGSVKAGKALDPPSATCDVRCHRPSGLPKGSISTGACLERLPRMAAFELWGLVLYDFDGCSQPTWLAGRVNTHSHRDTNRVIRENVDDTRDKGCKIMAALVRLDVVKSSDSRRDAKPPVRQAMRRSGVLQYRGPGFNQFVVAGGAVDQSLDSSLLLEQQVAGRSSASATLCSCL